MASSVREPSHRKLHGDNIRIVLVAEKNFPSEFSTSLEKGIPPRQSPRQPERSTIPKRRGPPRKAPTARKIRAAQRPREPP